MKIDVGIKVGGSLGRWKGLGKLLDSIARWKGATKVLVIPGGGVFADLVRAEYRRVRLTERAAHRMAILAMDQYGLQLCDLASRAAPASSLNQVREVIRSGRLPVYLSSRSLARHDPFTHSWGVTSDSIAAYVAGRVGAKDLLPSASSPRPPSSATCRKGCWPAGSRVAPSRWWRWRVSSASW